MAVEADDVDPPALADAELGDALISHVGERPGDAPGKATSKAVGHSGAGAIVGVGHVGSVGPR